MMKKWIAWSLCVVLLLLSLTGCRRGGESSSDGSPASSGTASVSGVKLTLLNSKGEIQTGLEKLADEYEKKTGVSVEIIACGAGESPYTKLTGMYNSGTAPTLAMIDTTDVIALGVEKGVDLTDQKWVGDSGNTALTVDGKVYGFPFCVEGRGLIYNRAAIEETLGEEFDPATINSYDALKTLLEKLRAKGMEYPVVVTKEDWSLGAHMLGYVYDTYDGTTEGSEKLIGGLKAGTLDMANQLRYQQFIQTMELLLKYNVNHADPLGALYEQDPIFLADKKAAIWANGNWAWPNLAEADANAKDGYGFLPFVLGNDTADFANNAVQACPSKYIMVDRTQSSPDEIRAAKEFLNWLVYDEEGQKLLVEECGIIPAFANNPNKATDPLSADIQAKMAEKKVYTSAFIAPGDHWSVLGASMQKFIAGQQTKEQLAAEINAYWQKQK